MECVDELSVWVRGDKNAGNNDIKAIIVNEK